MTSDCPSDPHPPTDGRPSFNNGADDLAQGYDISRGVTAGSTEWMTEVERLVEKLEREWVKAVANGWPPAVALEARAALLAHLSAHPANGDQRASQNVPSSVGISGNSLQRHGAR